MRYIYSLHPPCTCLRAPLRNSPRIFISGKRAVEKSSGGGEDKRSQNDNFEVFKRGGRKKGSCETHSFKWRLRNVQLIYEKIGGNIIPLNLS